MHDHRDPWKWPVVLAVTVAVWLAGAFLLPRSWIAFILATHQDQTAAQATGGDPWLVLLPPPEIVVRPDDEPPPHPDTPPPPPREHIDPQWWVSGMRVRIVDARSPQAAVPRPTLRDTLNQILHELGLVEELTMIPKPDSTVAAALLILQREDALRFDALKPYFNAVARSRDYADIMSRAADMYGDFLQQEIMVPD